MAKAVYRQGSIILGGKNLSHWVDSWQIFAKLGDVYRVELTLLDSPGVIQVTPGGKVHKALSVRVNTNAKILVRSHRDDPDWFDVSSWTYGYDRIARADQTDLVRLHLHADSDVLSINGTHPWEFKADG